MVGLAVGVLVATMATARPSGTALVVRAGSTGSAVLTWRGAVLAARHGTTGTQLVACVPDAGCAVLSTAPSVE
jgi:hypothetical protein